MSFRNTLAVAVLFLALGAYLYFVESEKVREEAETKTLLDVDQEKVDGIRLEYPGDGTVFSLRKTAGGWQLQEPIEAGADQTAVENLVRAVAEAELKRTLEGEVASAETYGLDTPDTIVTLHLDDGASTPAIRVGKTSPVGYSAFVQLDGESAIKLVPSSFATGMKKELTDLRDKEIVSFDESQVRRIEIDLPPEDEPDVELVREDERWTLKGAEAVVADEAEVRTFLSSLRSMRAQSFVDDPEPLERFGLDHPRRRITLVVGEDEARHEILVGDESERDGKKELYVRRTGADTIYAVGPYVWSNVGKQRSTFRDKTVLPFDRERLGAIEVTRADGGSFRIVRDAPAEETSGDETGEAGKEAAWIVEGAAGSSRGSQVNQLVGDIHGLKGYEVAAERPEDLSPWGLASPAFVFSLIDREGVALGRMLVSQVDAEGDSGETRSYAMAEGGALVFRIRDYLYAHLDKKHEDLVEPPAVASEDTEPSPAAREGN